MKWRASLSTEKRETWEYGIALFAPGMESGGCNSVNMVFVEGFLSLYI